MDYSDYVHEFTNDDGEVRFAVAALVNGQYTRPIDVRMQKLTGCSQEYTRDIKQFGGYKERRQALRRARYLFGGS